MLSKVTCPLGCSSKVKCIQGSVSLNESSVKDEPQPDYSSQNGYLLSKKQCIDMKRKMIILELQFYERPDIITSLEINTKTLVT